MQRSGVTPDDADRVAEESHELPERTIVCDGVGLPTGCFDCGDQIFLPRTMVQDATHSESVPDFVAERAVAIRGPALRAPAACRAQHDVPFNPKTSQELQHEHFLNRGDCESDRGHTVTSARAE